MWTASGPELSAATLAATPVENLPVAPPGLQSGEIVAKLTLEQGLPAVPVGVALNNPFRIYFDLHQVSNGIGKNYQESLEGDLRSINVVQVVIVLE